MTPFARILFPYRRRTHPYGISRATPSVPENRNSLGGSETLDPPDCGRRSGVSPHLPKTLLQLHRNAPVDSGIFLPLRGWFSPRGGRAVRLHRKRHKKLVGEAGGTARKSGSQRRRAGSGERALAAIYIEHDA